MGSFVRDGFVKVPAVVPREVADEACARLWERIEPVRDDPATWTRPVVWTADLTGEGPFGQVITSEILARALDAVAGPKGWAPRATLGNIPVRFPHSEASNDDGWHIDSSVPVQDGQWAVSAAPHALLLLVLLSDVGPDDAPTRIRIGSHHDVPQVLSEEPMDPSSPDRSSTPPLLGDRSPTRRASRGTPTSVIPFSSTPRNAT